MMVFRWYVAFCVSNYQLYGRYKYSVTYTDLREIITAPFRLETSTEKQRNIMAGNSLVGDVFFLHEACDI